MPLLPDDHDRAGALGHDAPCPWCYHAPHRHLPCGDSCGCTHTEQLGIDTAFNRGDLP